MKLRSLLLVVLLLSPSTTWGLPITSGVWSQVPNIDRNQDPFWDGRSWDCSFCGVGSLLAGYTGLAGLEYLHDGSRGYVPFRFDDPAITPSLIFSLTGWSGGVLGRDATGAFTYDSGTGRLSDSWQRPGQYALFRRVGIDTTRYFLGIEDILLTEARNDRDYNDHVVTFITPTQSVPEPSTMLLMGTALIGLAARKLR